MLIEFSTTNFRSYRERQTLTMVRGKLKDDDKLDTHSFPFPDKADMALLRFRRYLWGQCIRQKQPDPCSANHATSRGSLCRLAAGKRAAYGTLLAVYGDGPGTLRI